MTAAGDSKAEGNQRAAGFMPDLAALDTGGNAKKESDKAAKLAERRRQQLADADKLLATENGRLEISAAANELEKIQAEYDKTKVERRIQFLALQKGALSEQARERYAEAQFVAVQADRFEYNAKIQKLMEDQTKELYSQVGLAKTLDKELQRSMGSAFGSTAGTGTFRTDVDLMPGLTGGELGTKMEELKKSLADLQDPIKQVMAGAQAIGEAFGATVSRAPELLHGKTSEVIHNATGVLTNLPSPFTATRYHSLAVERDTVPDVLEITGSTESGVVMSLRHKSLPIEGVQFHPESVLTEHGHQMLANWLVTCGDSGAPKRAVGLSPVVGRTN
jgi:anthranilate synthase/aminodeoxychorismate synthase-like glutamine amidotransferase